MTILDYLYATVAYGDIFDYPLSGDDIYYWSIQKTPRKNFRAHPIPGVTHAQYLYCLKGRQGIIDTYNERHTYSKTKWEAARSIGMLLQFIPTIFLVGVTGGVAVNNASSHDDIDFFFITAHGALWISRLLVIVALDILGRRRKPTDMNVTNKICLNMFMSEEAMSLPRRERDLFSAHEVLQMEPIWSRRDTYRRFLQANAWVETYLPVAWTIKQSGFNRHPKISHWYTHFARQILRWFELPAKYFQLWYMARRRTREVITEGVLRFHPKDARLWIRDAFAKRLKKRKIPLDKIFYAR